MKLLRVGVQYMTVRSPNFGPFKVYVCGLPFYT